MKEKIFRKIYIEITNICNLKCKFCPETKRKKQFMSVDEFRIVINKIKPYTNLIYLHVKGEPLLHPNLKEILKICEQHNMQINLTTNGTLLLKNIDYIIESQSIRQINLSIHSIYQNQHNETYNPKIYLDEIIKATKQINKKTNIFISYRLWNIQDIKQNEKNIEIIHRLEKEYHIENLLNIAQKNKAIKLKDKIYLNQDIQFTWPNISEKVISEVGKCWGIRNQIAILVNGDIVPCCLDQEGDIYLGNIYKDDIQEILQSDRVKRIIHGFESHQLIHPLCKRCGFRTRFGNE